MHKKQELLKNTFILGLGILFAKTITFILLPFYTIYLSPSEYGTVDLILTYTAYLAPFLILQSDWAVFKFLVDSRGDKDETKRIASTSLHMILIMSIVSILLLFIAGTLISAPYVPYIALLTLSTILSTAVLQYSRGIGQNIQYAISSTITGMFTAITFLIFVVQLSMGARGLLLTMGLSPMIGTFYLVSKLKIYKHTSLSGVDKKLRKKMLTYSWPLVPEGVSYWIMNVSDRTIISVVLGVAANGVYAVANRYSLILNAVFSVFNLSWGQSITEHIDTDDGFVSDVSNATVRIFGSFGLAMISVLPLIFSLLFAKAYNEAYGYIPILVIANVFFVIAGVYSGVYIAKNMTKQIARTTVFAAIINLVVNLALISLIGMYAAAISTLIAYLVLAIYRHYDVRKYVNIFYNMWVLIGLFAMYIIVVALYYINDNTGNIVSIILTILYVGILNKALARSAIDKFFGVVSSKLNNKTEDVKRVD
jgi:O-antigen/teichoic acid export membrane protein